MGVNVRYDAVLDAGAQHAGLHDGVERCGPVLVLVPDEEGEDVVVDAPAEDHVRQGLGDALGKGGEEGIAALLAVAVDHAAEVLDVAHDDVVGVA